MLSEAARGLECSCRQESTLYVDFSGHLFLGEPGGGVEPESYLVLLGPIRTLCDQSLINHDVLPYSPGPRAQRCHALRKLFEMLVEYFSGI